MVLRCHDHSAPAHRTLCVGRELTMPELPEVETARRGLQPVMEGAPFLKVIAHRGDLRWPLGQDFAARPHCQTFEGLGRRAKYLLADISSCEVLVTHLGRARTVPVP